MPAIVDRLQANRLVLGMVAALAAVGIATGIGIALDLDAKPGAQVVFVALAAAAAAVGGLWSGLFAGALSFPLFIYFFLNRPRSFDVAASRVTSLVVLGLGCALVAYIVARERRARALSASAREVDDSLGRAGVAMWDWDPERDRLRWSHDLPDSFGLARAHRLDSLERLLEAINAEDRERGAVGVRRGALVRLRLRGRGAHVSCAGRLVLGPAPGRRPPQPARQAGLRSRPRRHDGPPQRRAGALPRRPDAHARGRVRLRGDDVGTRPPGGARARRLVLDRRGRRGRQPPQRRIRARRPGQGRARPRAAPTLSGRARRLARRRRGRHRGHVAALPRDHRRPAPRRRPAPTRSSTSTRDSARARRSSRRSALAAASSAR